MPPELSPNAHYRFSIPFCTNPRAQTGLAEHAKESSGPGTHGGPSNCHQSAIKLPSDGVHLQLLFVAPPAPRSQNDMQKLWPLLIPVPFSFSHPFIFKKFSVITEPGLARQRSHFPSTTKKKKSMIAFDCAVNAQNNRPAFKGGYAVRSATCEGGVGGDGTSPKDPGRCISLYVSHTPRDSNVTQRRVRVRHGSRRLPHTPFRRVYVTNAFMSPGASAVPARYMNPAAQKGDGIKCKANYKARGIKPRRRVHGSCLLSIPPPRRGNANGHRLQRSLPCAGERWAPCVHWGLPGSREGEIL